MRTKEEIELAIAQEQKELAFLQSFNDTSHIIEANIPSAKINILRWVLEE